MTKYLIILFFTFALTSIAKSDTYMENIYKGCVSFNEWNRTDKPPEDEIEVIRSLMCKSFIWGFLLGSNAQYETYPDVVKGCGDEVYHPDNLSKLLVKFLQENPNYFTKPSEEIMTKMFQTNFPCN